MKRLTLDFLKPLYSFTFILLILLGLTGNLVNGQSSVKLFTNSDLGLTLEYPIDWIATDQKDSYENEFALQIFFSPEDDPDNNTLISFSALNVGNYTLSEYTAFSYQHIIDDLNNENVISNNQSSKFGNLDTAVLNISYIGHDEIDNKLFVQEISTINNQTMYSATLVSPEEIAADMMTLFKNFITSILLT